MSTTLTTLGKNAGLLGIGSDITGLPTNVYYDAETGKIYERPLSGGVFLEVFDPQKQTTYRSSFITDINNLDKNYQSILREKNPESEINPETRQLIEQAKNNPTIAPKDPNSDSSGITGDELTRITTETGKDVLTGTRKTYPNVKYPENLNLKDQDCIKFSILEYKPRTLSIALNQNRRIPTGRTSLGTITLPVPAGISDRNNANWQDDRMNILAQGFGAMAMSFMHGGTSAAVNSAQESIDSILGGNTDALAAFASAKLTENAIGSNVLSRQFGAVVNENLELLFNGPSLRNFTFNFRFTPREPKEAKNVRTIIRYFKQAMSAKRTESVLLLKTPHTFGIEYLSSNEVHPYLNKFKECALTDCAVNYTPDGTYMTYSGKLDERSMTAYELSLTFQELEPIFDDDYGNEAEINSIGY
jgi:hypothetical protein